MMGGVRIKSIVWQVHIIFGDEDAVVIGIAAGAVAYRHRGTSGRAVYATQLQQRALRGASLPGGDVEAAALLKVQHLAPVDDFVGHRRWENQRHRAGRVEYLRRHLHYGQG